MDLDILRDYGRYREEKGVEQGIEQGIEKGIEQGIEKVKTAINMLNKGYSIEQIAEITELDFDSIKQLKNSK